MNIFLYSKLPFLKLIFIPIQQRKLKAPRSKNEYFTFDNISTGKNCHFWGSIDLHPYPKRVLGEGFRGKEEGRSGGMAQMLARYRET